MSRSVYLPSNGCKTPGVILPSFQGPSVYQTQRGVRSGLGAGVPRERELPGRSERLHAVPVGTDLDLQLSAFPGRRGHLQIRSDPQYVQKKFFLLLKVAMITVLLCKKNENFSQKGHAQGILVCQKNSTSFSNSRKSCLKDALLYGNWVC